MTQVGWQDQVVARIGCRDTGALGELYDRLGGRVYRVALAMTPSPRSAEDITLAVFVEAWRDPRSLARHQDRLGAYLTHLARCRASSLRAHQDTDSPAPR